MPVWTRPAARDLAAQLEYIQGENPEIVAAVAARIKAATNSLDAFPQLGCDGLEPGTRELVIPRLPFVCVYQVRDGRVEILRLLHERMQWPR